MVCSALLEFITAEFSQVRLDRKIVITNRRLGIIFKLLQVFALILIVLIIVVPQSWRKQYRPKQYDVSLWRESGPSTAYKANNVRHCTHVSEYSFNWSATWSYAPSKCRSLSARQLFLKQGSNVYHPTYIDEGIDWKGECSDNNRNACLSQFADVTYSEAEGECRCTAREQYFVKNAEESRIVFLHGALVELDSHMQAKARLDQDFHVLVHSDGQETTVPGEMITVFEKHDGSPCMLDGRSEWKSNEASLGVGGSLKELLACADVTLDSDPRLLDVSGKPAPHLRTMGLVLELRISYQYPSHRHDGILAVIHVVPRPVWNSVKVVEYTQQVGSLSNGTAEIEKYMYGVSQLIVVDGFYYRFNAYELMTSIVNAFVVWSIPRVLLEFIALYFVGQVSSVFRRVVHQKFNMYNAITDTLSKLMISSMTFRCMKNAGFKVPASDIPGISKAELNTWMKDVFNGGIASGHLSEDELDRVSSYLVHEQEKHQIGHSDEEREDSLGDGVISFTEFCAANVAQEAVTTRDMIRILDVEAPRSCLELIFDDTAQKISSAANHDASQRARRASLLGGTGSDQLPSDSLNGHGAQEKDTDENPKIDGGDDGSDLPAWARDYIDSLPNNSAASRPSNNATSKL
eukprot:TRINITY_DN102394_c0_g1_i1.p1 TRINITY_DN102394_c0_g1~~TRINITY_DN102394_c0_g1_i1.p1  ORF type:complete len:632 (-),score=82.20 TRINITY_DN102394_c0_g1_i1:263-2158(-)